MNRQTIKLQEINSQDFKGELSININDNGDRSWERWDRGEIIKKLYDDYDEEYFLTVKRQDKDMLLLQLIKDRFSETAVFKAYLDERKIPYSEYIG